MRRVVDPRQELLETLPFFDGCARKQLAELARVLEEVRLESGEVVVREGRPGQHFYLLAEGLAHVTVRGRRVGSVKPGSFFGEMAILEGQPRAATVTTALPSRLLVLDARRFRTLVSDAPAVAQRIMRGLAARLRDVEEQLETPASSPRPATTA